MTETKTTLEERIDSGKPLLLAEISPPRSGDAAAMRNLAGRFAGKVHALGVCDNRERVCMSALAAASLAVEEGVEPILHVATRDRNRAALVSDYLGAAALGVGNVLCTSGTHQTLARFRAARNVFDIDSIQLLQTYAGLATDASIVGETAGINGAPAACLGAVAAPFADLVELQMMRLIKKIAAGARFLITQPVFDCDRFETWWSEVTDRGIHERVAVAAGIEPLIDAESAQQYAQQRPSPMIPEALLQRIASAGDAAAQKAAGIEIAVETIKRLSGVAGLRGFQICGDRDAGATLQVIEKSGLTIE